MSRDILLLMYKNDYLCKKTKKTGNKALYTEYKQVRNKVVNDIRKAKSDHYTSRIIQSKSAKEMWKVIRYLIKINKSAPSSISAENFNDYFLNIGPQINKTFPGDPILYWSLPESIYTFKLRPIGVNEVESYISKLSTESKKDILGFKDGSHALLTSLTSLFNKSILNHQLPADWKSARVIPIFKGTGSINEPCHYRPISVMSLISKILEKCINSQVLDYFENHELLICNQSAFRNHHSTLTASHKLVDDLLDNMNEKLINGACFFDLKCVLTQLITHS